MLQSLLLDAALFDLDGTLVRTFIDFPALRDAMHRLARDAGEADATDHIDDILEIVQVLVERKGGTGNEEGRHLRETAYRILADQEREGCARAEAIDTATNLLVTLRERGVKIGIITRNCREVAEELTRRMNLPHDVLIAREDTEEFKPHPAPLLVACEQMGVMPSRVSMTGDLWADVAAGQAAGAALTIGIQWPYDPPQRFARAKPDVEVNSLAEAVPYLVKGSQAGR